MVPPTRGLPGYPVDDIVELTPCTLVVPYGRMSKKNTMATGVARPPGSRSMYGNKPIPLEYARVDVAWTNADHDDDELDIPTPHGLKYYQEILGEEVL
jgi:hypothetical protein